MTMTASNELSVRLQDMLRLKSINDETASSASSDPSKPRRLIEVIADHEASNSKGSQSNRDAQGDDDEPPPPIYFYGGSEASCKHQHFKTTSTTTVSNPETPTLSLAEQMMEHANRAALLTKHQEVSRTRKSASKATFGVKKGFLNPTSKSATKQSQPKSMNQTKQQRQQKNHQNENSLIYELDQDGNMTPILPIPSSAHPQSSSSPLILPEAQNAISSHLQHYIELTTPELMESINEKHPKLARGLTNPKFMAALQSMQENPKETLTKLKSDAPEVLEFIQEFCGVMGDHFVKLGEKQDKVHQHTIKHATDSSVAKIREMGPLEEKALRQHNAEILRKKHDKSNNHCDHDSDKAMDDQVSAILENNDLRSILMDPKMQHIVEECSTIGGKLHFYMRHEEYGPKLRRMMEAGLLKLA